ncbi:MAG TPA: tRNA (N(6)-L-threonylcarbamoyladenosine(37)-C(2))-methylthiotransferase MtaB, partial [Bacteroidales bacterium]|nr:tRNA (N(6)-L-threonylcarbamoyladenosine(37)-C(2))-methylthiotransferase MtaB [Bacteroidales bacterium]
MERRIAFKTLGCRLNQYETEALASRFNRHDYEIVPFGEKADVYVVNSCTVTNQSDRKSRNILQQAHKSNREGLVVVTGCISPDQRKILENKSYINYIVDNKNKSSVYNLIEAHFNGEMLKPESLPDDYFEYDLTEKIYHTRSFIKIQDGCDNFCTFCIIPFVRGRAVSRPVEKILKNAREAIQSGYKELVITGVNIGRYDHAGTNFEDLIEKILNLPGDFRLRISSLEPEGLGKKFINLTKHPKFAPHLHLCLQSGSDRILIRMKRMYSVGSFQKLIENLRKVRSDMNFTTDIMVGFPGETDEDFKQTCSMSRSIGFSHIHTFKYSIRAGTRAERMPEQVPEKVKSKRSEEIRKISDENQ